jgi:hypothetical protein
MIEYDEDPVRSSELSLSARLAGHFQFFVELMHFEHIGLEALARGPGLVAQIMFGSGPGSNDSNQTLCRTFRAFSGHYFLAKKKLFIVALILCSWHSRAPETNPTDSIFSGIFVAAPLPEIVRDNILQTWHLMSLYRSSNARVTSDVLRASLNNSFKYYWHLCKKRIMY